MDINAALGGFLSAGQALDGSIQYEKATSVILTFLVQNHYNKTLLDPALRWEKRYTLYILVCFY